MNPEHVTAITRSPLFRSYTDAGAQQLLGSGEIRELATGEALFVEGEPSEFAAVLLQGDLQIFVERDGKELVLSLIQPGVLIGELGVLCGAPRSASVRAATDASLLVFSPSAFRRLLLSDASLSQRVFGQALQGLVEKERALIDELLGEKPAD